MNRKAIFTSTLTVLTSLAISASALGQYQSSLQYGTYGPPRTQLPQWNSSSSPTSTYQPNAAPHAYSPSQMPSVNPFANVRSQQQLPTSYGNASYPPATQYQGPTQYQTSASRYQAAPSYQPATPTYNTYSVSSGDPQYPVGGGATYSGPTQQVVPAPTQELYYDQPAQSYAPQIDYACDPKSGGCASGIGVRTGWYGSVGGILLHRDRGNNVWLSYDQTDIRDRTLNTNDADFDYAGGTIATIGHYFNCGRNSIQFAYWGAYPGIAEANSYGADTAVGIDTILHYDGLQYDAGLGGGAQDLSGTFFFGADRHRVQRNYDVYNIELNLLGHNFTSGCGPWQLGWLAGVRYLRFDDDFLYSSDVIDTTFTGDAREVHYDIDVENNLIGFQIGGRANYCVGARLNLFADTKVGIYGNHMSHRSRIYGANGQAFVGDAASPYFGQDVDFASNKDNFAMIGDLSIGANWCISRCWSINVGYRAVGASGVALSTAQIPVDFIGALDSVRRVNSNGNVILHGAFAGVNFCY